MLNLTRYFTRSGRDPLTLAPFESRLVGSHELRVPSAWPLPVCEMMERDLVDEGAGEWIVSRARSRAEALRSTSWAVTEETILALGDEFAWMMARSMGWLDASGDVVVGVVNLAPFCEPVSGRFELAGLKQTVRVLTILAAAEAARKGSPHRFACGWTNMAGLMASAGIPYDAERALGIAGCVAAMILGEASLQAAVLSGLAPDAQSSEMGRAVLLGLQNARSRAAELPPTRQDAASPGEPDRWKTEAVNSLDAAISAVSAKGILTPAPVAAGPCREAEAWLSPLGTMAEAMPSLDVPDLARRLEIRSAMRAIGLADVQKEELAGLLQRGESLASLGIPVEKTGSLRTALGGWSFHPNAQISMASAVAPFVAGPLQHRVYLPSGVPAEFTASLKEFASRLALPGLVFVEAPGAAVSSEDAQAPETASTPQEDAEPSVHGDAAAIQTVEEPNLEVEAAPVLPQAEEASLPEVEEPLEPGQVKHEEVEVLEEPEPSPEEAAESAPAPTEEAHEPDPVDVAEPDEQKSEAEVLLPSPAEAVEHVSDRAAVVFPSEAPAGPEGLASEALAKESDAAAQSEPMEVETEWEAPARVRRKVVESRTVQAGDGLFVHVMNLPTGPEILVTWQKGSASERALLDSFARSVALGLAKGVTVQEYLESVKDSDVAKQVLEAAGDALPSALGRPGEEGSWYIKNPAHVPSEDPRRSGRSAAGGRGPGGE